MDETLHGKQLVENVKIWNWCTPKALVRFKCEFEGENNKRKNSGDTFLNS
jgi:hypothetical protein